MLLLRGLPTGLLVGGRAAEGKGPFPPAGVVVDVVVVVTKREGPSLYGRRRRVKWWRGDVESCATTE
jgi:hypothetical protein